MTCSPTVIERRVTTIGWSYSVIDEAVIQLRCFSAHIIIIRDGKMSMMNVETKQRV